ncbi:TetR/AcrR family transcriptional regulator [Actinoalloteichus caeruleus]|uniref:Transcriptional regulator, TetR family n=1 Tax=Actinoalloteichus caeruleus DSM 43889 TaxID=1120930 RepID=A0ABT1JIC8_ACTCY|nr:TetR/AcrR family transcriptional regulator [Actinoalloteichus caeruleus]MCP2331906.1 transcriptional regulator, TetR family [Actinoalloteichus caeruleus DSM 43889]
MPLSKVLPMSAARDRILDALESLLIDKGVLAATLDAVASEAGVSKGGLLYHFGSKEALFTGMLERLRARGVEDVQLMLQAPGGPTRYHLETSMVEQGDPLHRSFVAATLLAQSTGGQARDVIVELNERYLRALLTEIDDPELARIVQLVGDGLYFNLAIDAQHPSEVAPVLERVRRLVSEADRR